MRRHHSMPFGAEPGADGTRFRLWAPDADAVEVAVHAGGQPRLLPMRRGADGWFECLTGAAGPGSRYAFRLAGGATVPDPASRCQPDDVHGLSEVVDSGAFDWQDRNWRGRPWEEAVIYELHVGTFTKAGTFSGVTERLDYLQDLGVTAIELMPVAEFPGRRGWGYDGALLFAPESGYGRPADLKRLIQEAHRRGIMVLLDVVYNHFGPDGNYLGSYAQRFFTDRHRTPWGNSNNFDGDGSQVVRQFFIENALYWLEEYHFDGLRLDAVHAIYDDSPKHFLVELAETVHARFPDRHIHLILENDHNQPELLGRDERGRPKLYTAQWNDDFHHVLHLLLTGETSGYYNDYAENPMRWLARCLEGGFAYQGEASPYRGGRPRGGASGHLPPAAFVGFLQNHDQVGNRALGERIGQIAPPEALRAAMALMLLAPFPPMLFMGEERRAHAPFLYFCEFASEELVQAVRRGRREEFAGFPEFASAEARAAIPDPNAAATFEASVLEWPPVDGEPHHGWRDFIHDLIYLRRRHVAPYLAKVGKAQVTLPGGRRIQAAWPLPDGTALVLHGNLGSDPVDAIAPPPGRLIFGTHGAPDALPAWCIAWYVAGKGAAA